MNSFYQQFFRFAFAGTLGFVVDAATVMALIKGPGLDLISAKLLAFLVAVTATWWVNRRITFSAYAHQNKAREWLQYVLANGTGGIANNLAYIVAVTQSPWFAQQPVLAVALGSIVGLAFNFVATRWWVFRAHLPVFNQR